MWALGNLGQVMMETGDYENAKVYLNHSLVIARRGENLDNISTVLSNLGTAFLAQENYREAQRCYEECLEIARQIGDRMNIPRSLINLAEVLHNLGKPEVGLAHYREGLRALAEMGDKASMTATLESVAFVLIDLRQTERALRLLGACAAIREALGTPIRPREQARTDKFLARAHSQISADEFARCWNEGRALTLDQALSDVLDSP